MFDVGFWEVFIILIMGLVILGPERLPKVLRMLGLWMGRARASYYSLRSEVERELRLEEMEKARDRIEGELRGVRDEVDQDLKGVREDLDREIGQMRGEVDELERELQSPPEAVEPPQSQPRKAATEADSGRD